MMNLRQHFGRGIFTYYLQQIELGWQFFRENGCKKTFLAFSRRNSHPIIQFIKYGICGVVSVILLAGMMAGYALIWPELLNSSVNHDPNLRAFWFQVFTWISFIPVNTFVWLVNRQFIFLPGLHHPVKEYLYFSIISAISQAIGLLLPDYLISVYNIPSYLALGCLIICSTLFNFIFRKIFIFAS